MFHRKNNKRISRYILWPHLYSSDYALIVRSTYVYKHKFIVFSMKRSQVLVENFNIPKLEY